MINDVKTNDEGLYKIQYNLASGKLRESEVNLTVLGMILFLNYDPHSMFVCCTSFHCNQQIRVRQHRELFIIVSYHGELISGKLPNFEISRCDMQNIEISRFGKQNFEFQDSACQILKFKHSIRHFSRKKGVGRQHTTFTSCQNAACFNEFFLWRVDYALEEEGLTERM